MSTSETETLKNAFHEFSRASDSIISYYSVLEGRIRALQDEINRKNAELERAGQYLYYLLNSLPVGVVVTDRESVVFSNKRAERFGAVEFLKRLNPGDRDAGELKHGRNRYQWKKEKLANEFEGKDVIVFEDITEIEKMKERLERDERLMAMGEMAARIAHEIKNPLGSMELFLSMLSNGKLRVKDRQYVDYILFGVKTVDRIINNLLSYTKPKTLALSEARLGRLVKETVDFMGVSATNRGIAIDLNIEFDGTSCFDPDLMKLVVMNFVSNAIEAINHTNGVIGVRVRAEGQYAVISVADNGVGMSEEVRKNIFNPFFTTKDKGVGLGLFIVYNIVKAHGGYVELESLEGSGSSFSIYIPRDGV